MKKIHALILALLFIAAGSHVLQAVNPDTPVNAPAGQTLNLSNTQTATPAAADAVIAPQSEQESGHQVLKDKFIEGDPLWMTPVLICFLLGLSIVIERIISLYLMGINTPGFIRNIEEIIKSRGIEAAKEECRNTRGPVASIYYQGLDRIDEGIEKVESAVQSYGSVQMGQLEKGMVWISLFIALSPMLGFLGTVVGMIQAFDKISLAGDISPTIVADGIKVALLTTVAGLIVAIILQVFYNLILSRIDAMANEMEDAAISLTDILIKNKIVQ